MKHLLIKTALILPLLWTGLSPRATAEVYRTANGTGSFSVSAPAKTIQAETQQVQLELDGKTGRLFLKVPVNSFRFQNNFISDSMNAVIYERFNTHYMQSGRFPYVTYNARILNTSEIDLGSDGDYPLEISGTLEIHGTQKQVRTLGQITVNKGRITVKAHLTIKPEDYNIPIPEYIGSMYFKEVHIESSCLLKAAPKP